jgi:hypothetical protein
MQLKTRPQPIIHKKNERISTNPPVSAVHELTIKFTELPKPTVGEQEIRYISLRLNDPPFYVKIGLRKKQWNKLVKNVDATEGTWIAAGRGRIKKIEKRTIYLENVGFQVFEKKPKGES